MNQFGKTSHISVKAEQRDGKTVLSDVSFTAPYKIMHPFEEPDGGIKIIPVCASAGIMSGDRQEFSYQVGTGAKLEVLSQSYDKIHKMTEGDAGRQIRLVIGKQACLTYAPQPVIPFAESSFRSQMNIFLEDETSHLFLQDILSCGRIAYREQFQYRLFQSEIRVYRSGKLIFRDNTRYEPEKMDMTGFGMYEGFTHMANLLLMGSDRLIQEKIQRILDEMPAECEGGITRLEEGDYVVRILGRRAQQLEQISENIRNLYLSESECTDVKKVQAL